MSNQKVSTSQQLRRIVSRLGRRSLVLFLVFIGLTWGFLAYQISSFNSAQPDPNDVSSGLQTAGVPHIDEDAVRKIEQLQDNSVSVQTLFNEARDNPFDEQ